MVEGLNGAGGGGGGVPHVTCQIFDLYRLLVNQS